MDEPKPPCRGCDHEFKSKDKGVCENCPLPFKYNEALNKKQFQIFDFLRHSTPNNWGTKKREIKVQEISIVQKYCEQENVDLSLVLSKARTPIAKEARQKIVSAMVQNDMDYKEIADHLKMSRSAIWNYLHMTTHQDLIERVLDGLPDIHKQLCKIAKEQERTTLYQARWIIKEYVNKQENV